MSIVSELETRSWSNETALFPASVQDRLQMRASKLRMMPAIAMQALELAKDPDCGIDDFSAVVERDPGLAAEILRMANSVMFGSGRSILNLHQAVVRIGLSQCRNLIVAASFSSMVKTMSLHEQRTRELLCQHSFTTALLCLYLNRSLKLGFQGEEFTGGLIHDVGRMLLATCYPERISEIDPLTFDEGADTLRDEEAFIETNHCSLGEWFTRKNQIPGELTSVVRFHHSPELSPPTERRFVALVAACDHMANHLQRTQESSGYDVDDNRAIGLLEDCGVAKLSPRFRDVAAQHMDAAMHDAKQILAT